MLGMLTVASMTAWSGCAVDFPEPLNEEVDAPARADEAQAFAVAAWSERFEVELDDPPPVLWFGPAPDGSRCLRYDDELVAPVDGCLSGMTPMVAGGGPYQVHLIAYGPRPSASGIVHEHLHWALDRTTGDCDEGHVHAVWAEVHVLEDELKAVGL